MDHTLPGNMAINKQDAIIRFIMNKRWSWVRHLLLLLLILINLFPFVSVTTDLGLSAELAGKITDALRMSIACVCGFSIVAVYINLLFMVPKFLLKGRYVAYIIAMLVLGILYYLALTAINNYFFVGIEKYIDQYDNLIEDFVSKVTIPMVFIGATAGYKVFKKWIKDSERLSALQQAQMQNELTHLKNQVNPHFLFNTLNNIRTLNQIDTSRANQVLLGLSDILRYQIYESSRELVPLKKDVDMLDEYLMLEKIRRDDFKYNIVVTGDAAATMVPPLLFINFVENAIKHGANSRNASFCEISFVIGADRLSFTCSNSKPSMMVKGVGGGLGIKNVERRLQLLYDNNYTLTLTDEIDLYTVQLSIPV